MKRFLLIFFSLLLFIILIMSYKTYEASHAQADELLSQINTAKTQIIFKSEQIIFQVEKDPLSAILPFPIFPLFGNNNGKRIVVTTTIKDLKNHKIDLNKTEQTINVFKHPKDKDFYFCSSPTDQLNYVKSLNYLDFIYLYFRSAFLGIIRLLRIN